MLTQCITSVGLQTQLVSQDQPSQCTINLLFKNFLTKTKKIPILKCWINLQNKTKSTSESIGTGKFISKKMRAKLINWMEKLALETFEFSIQTLLLAIKILDQYLCLTNQSPSSLQLIGCASLYLAAKTSEIVIVAGQCYVVSAANSFTEKQLLEKEMEIYKTLHYNTTFSSLVNVYKYMKQNFACSNLKHYIKKDVYLLFLEIAKNLDFLEFRQHQVVSMFIVLVQLQNQMPQANQILTLLKKFSTD